MFVAHGLVLGGVGVAIGIAVAAGMMRLMSTMLFDVSPADPLTYGVVSLALIAAATLASYIPGRARNGRGPDARPQGGVAVSRCAAVWVCGDDGLGPAHVMTAARINGRADVNTLVRVRYTFSLFRVPAGPAQWTTPDCRTAR